MSGTQGVLPVVLEVCEDDSSVTARAGLLVVVETLRALGMPKVVQEELKVRRRRGGSTEYANIEWLVTLLASGGECLDDIDTLRADRGLCRLLGSEPPSADVLRRFLYEFDDPKLAKQAMDARKPDQKAYRIPENAPLAALGRVNAALVRRGVAGLEHRVATLDHDATVIESHKQEALAHYKGGRGYQPAVIFCSEADLVLADEFRDGNVPAGMANLDLIRRGFAELPSGVEQRFFRADSACYEERVLKWLADPKRKDGPSGTIGFTISADMTPQLRALCAAVPDSDWTLADDRVDETVTCADVVFTPGDWPKDAAPLRYVAMRIRKKQGVLFADGSDVRYLAIVSNRWEPSAPELLRWHWGKAGTIEHVHDVTKNDLGAGVLPCGRFGANAAWYRLSLLTYNVQSILKRRALPPELRRARPKRLRFSVFTVPGRIISHAGRLILRIGKSAEQVAGLLAARARLARLAAELAVMVT